MSLVIKDGLPVSIFPAQPRHIHILRRTAARQMFNALVETRCYDGALRVVQALLHHSTLESTERFIGMTAVCKLPSVRVHGSAVEVSQRSTFTRVSSLRPFACSACQSRW